MAALAGMVAWPHALPTRPSAECSFPPASPHLPGQGWWTQVHPASPACPPTPALLGPFLSPPPRHVSVPPCSCPEPHHARWHHAVSPPVLTLPSAFPCELCARAARRGRRRSGLLFQRFHSLGSRPFGWVTPHPPRTWLAMALLRLTWTVRSLSAGVK